MLRLRRSPSLLRLRLSPPAGLPLTEEGDPWNLSGKVYRTSERPVARGGFALVYTGETVIFPDRPAVQVAIKTLLCRNEEEPVKNHKRLQREANIWHKLPVNSHLALFLGYVLEELNDGNVEASLISLWYPNGSIEKYLLKNPEANREALCIGVIVGLKHLHENQPPIIHGDLKPNNILVSNEGHAVLCDFGLSAALQDDHTTLTTSNSGAGCVRYLSPECLEGKPSLAGDMYAFGCVGLQIIFKRIPYQDTTKDIAVLNKINKGCPPHNFPEDDAARENSTIARLFQYVITKCWEREPAMRLKASDAFWTLPCNAVSLQIKIQALMKQDPIAQASGTMVLEWLNKSSALPVDDDFRAIICRAARDASLAIISLLTGSGVSISAVASDALSSLFSACGSHPERDVDRVKMFHLFIDAGADSRQPQYHELDLSDTLAMVDFDDTDCFLFPRHLSLRDYPFQKHSLLLCLATYHHNTSLLSALLGSSQVVQSDHQALVVAAARPESKTVVEMLLAAGIPADGGIGVDLLSPLTIAAYHGNSDVMDLLLAAGADVHGGQSRKSPPYNPIYWEMRRMNTAAMSKLLDYHADPNFVFATSLLHVALRDGDSTAVTLLLKFGANPSRQDQNGQNAAFFVKNPTDLDLLIQNTPSLDLNLTGEEGETSLYRAMWKENAALVTRFLARGAHPNLGDSLPLHAALQLQAISSCSDMIALLLKSGADPSCLDSDGRNAAFFIQNPTDLNLLIQHTP